MLSEEERDSLRYAVLKNKPHLKTDKLRKASNYISFKNSGIITPSEYEEIRQCIFFDRPVPSHEEIEKLAGFKKLLDQGAIEPSEYDEKKKDLIPESPGGSYPFYKDVLSIENDFSNVNKLVEDGKYDAAISNFTPISNIRGYATLIEETKNIIYNTAMELAEKGERKTAKKLFASLAEYKDSDEQISALEEAEKQILKKRKKKIIALAIAVAIAFAGAGIGAQIYKTKKAEEAARIAAEKAKQAELERKEAERQAALEFKRKSEEMKPAIEKALKKNPVGICAESYYTVGLKSDGTVVSTDIKEDDDGYGDFGQTDVED
ncbi:MAG: hypothetical protein Q4A65_04200, partial [Bacillota bacterium]|nr:hypothetical protein [Bacillota bacterium]